MALFALPKKLSAKHVSSSSSSISRPLLSSQDVNQSSLSVDQGSTPPKCEVDPLAAANKYFREPNLYNMSEFILLDGNVASVTSKLTKSGSNIVKSDFTSEGASFRLVATSAEYDIRTDDVKWILDELVKGPFIATHYRVYRGTWVIDINVYPTYFKK
ncbi:hypothetical protein BGZ82_001208 [Podila clonocystis]|nr:hypothetical protein BGZ82_001208 [Podila clonocystis]